MTKTALTLLQNYLGKKNLSRGTGMFSTSIQKPPCLLQLASKHGCYTKLLLCTFKKLGLPKFLPKNNRQILQKPGNSTAEVTSSLNPKLVPQVLQKIVFMPSYYLHLSIVYNFLRANLVKLSIWLQTYFLRSVGFVIKVCTMQKEVRFEENFSGVGKVIMYTYLRKSRSEVSLVE